MSAVVAGRQCCANCARPIITDVAPLVLVRRGLPLRRFCGWKCLRHYAGAMAKRGG